MTDVGCAAPPSHTEAAQTTTSGRLQCPPAPPFLASPFPTKGRLPVIPWSRARACARHARERYFGCTGEKHLDCTDDIFGCTRIDYQVVSLADL